jgi:hypothetical protein
MHKRIVPLALLLGLAACQDETVSPLTPGALLQSESGVHPMNAEPPVSALSHGTGAIIDNAVVQLGINEAGHLNVGGGTLSSGNSPTNAVGLRYMPTNGESTAPGCLCEGWGVADASSGLTGYANISADGGVRNLTVESFSHDASSATSVVSLGGQIRVTHEYRPSSSANLYEALVTIENIGTTAIGDLRYTRTMDWDIAPNTFSEYVTVQGTADAANVLYASNNGFNSANPLGGRGTLWPHYTGDFTDQGPQDHGAHFDFGFGELAVGAQKQFRIFYGAAGTEADAMGALGAVGAEVYSFGQANYDGSGWEAAPNVGAPTGTHGATTGEPHTFIFAFSGVGGKPVGAMPVDIDIKPGSDPNSIKLNDKGDARIAVAVLSTEEFNAADVDAAKVTLGNEDGDDTPVAKRNNGTLMASPEDVDADGDLDLVLHFERLQLLDKGDLNASSTELVLLGELTDGKKIRGADAVRVIP